MKKVLLVFAILVVVVIGIAYALPRTVHVERSVVIAAPAAVVFSQVNALQNWQEWSPWSRRDPAMSAVYSGPDIGVGNTLQWDSENPDVGSGTHRIIESTPFDRIVTALDFGGMGTATSVWTFDRAGGRTLATWGFASDLGMNPVWRYMGLFFDSMVGSDYEEGLAALKARCEAMHHADLLEAFIANQIAVDDAVRALTTAQWTFQESPERWSVGGVTEHVTRSEDFIRQTIETEVLASPAASTPDSLDDTIARRVRDRSTRFTTIPPLEPQGLYATPSEALAAFHAARARTIDMLASAKLDLRAHAAPHPLGMTLDAHQWFMAGHVDRHLQQIADAKAHAAFPAGN